MKGFSVVALTLLIALSNLGMGRDTRQYDEEARAQEKLQRQMAAETSPKEGRNAMKNIGTGLKEMTIDNVRDVTSETAEGTVSEKPLIGTLDGSQQAGEKVVDNTIRGVKKVASLGLAKDDSYEIEPSEKGSGDPAKIKLFKF